MPGSKPQASGHGPARCNSWRPAKWRRGHARSLRPPRSAPGPAKPVPIAEEESKASLARTAAEPGPEIIQSPLPGSLQMHKKQGVSPFTRRQHSERGSTHIAEDSAGGAHLHAGALRAWKERALTEAVAHAPRSQAHPASPIPGGCAPDALMRAHGELESQMRSSLRIVTRHSKRH